MARPKKATVEYFSHKCYHGRILFVLESIWGNDGYSLFYKLYELLGISEGHIYDLNKAGGWDYLLTYIRLDRVSVDTMLLKLVELDVIDGELLKEGVLWSQCFVDDLEDVYTRRKVNKPIKPIHRGLCQQKPDSTELPLDNSRINPQSKVKYSKIKEKNYVPKNSSDNSEEIPTPKPTAKKTQAKISPSDAEAYRLSSLFLDLILKENPNSKLHSLMNGKREGQIHRWASDFDKLMRLDGQGPDLIERVIKFVTTDDFEKANVLSAAKLRERWDSLAIKAQKSKKYVDSEKQQPIESYEGKKYIIYGGMKDINKIMIMCSPKNMAQFLKLPEDECIFMNGKPVELKGIDASQYEIIRPTDDIFEKIYQEKIAKEQGDRSHV